MSHHACANCRRTLTASIVVAAGKLCDKCNWAAAAIEFRDETPTRRETIAPQILILTAGAA